MMVAKANLPKAPGSLGPAGSALWASLVAEYEFGAHHLETLRLACECLDRLAAASEALRADGLFCEDRFGQKRAHPAVETELSNKRVFSKLIRELGLDVAQVDEGYSRPAHSIQSRGRR
ncbi:MAG: hypothetical protein AMXMBFR7_26770 [Planctomycetota bacterium]